MRRRSHWAWGWEDKFPTREARENLGSLLTGTLEFDVDGIREAVPLDAVEIGSARLDAELPCCTDDREARVRHTYGRAYPDVVRGFYGTFEGPPDLVATPTTEEELGAVLAWASERDVAVVPFGGGTSVVGGVSTNVDGFEGVVSLDLAGLGEVLEVDDVSRAARIQAGATGPALEAALAEHGFTLRHYPQSFEFSTLGGWIATRAGGHFATGPTHIDDFVESTRMITPSGTMQTRRLPGSGAGPSPDRLVMGSEGVLGVITEAWMRVQPRPRYRSSASFRFERFRDAVAAVRTLAQSGLQPANCRLLDKTEAMINQVAFDGSHVLIVGFESPDVPVEAQMELAVELARGCGGTLPNPVRHRTPETDAEQSEDAGSWRDAFFDGPYLQSALVTLGIMADTFETAITWDRFDAFHRGVKERAIDVLERTCGGGLVSCRFTHAYRDGVAPYYTFIAPARRGGELEQWREVKAAVSDAVVDLGGTITHHHAVGRTHRPWVERQRPELFERVLRAAKQELDPRGILNPGVLISR